MNDSIVRAIAKSEAEKAVGLQNHSDVFETTNATPTIVLIIEVNDYSAGFIEVEVAAMTEDGTEKLSAKWIVGIHKETGLTIDPEDVLHSVIGIAGASFNVVEDTTNPAIELTGVAATNITWMVRTKEYLLNITPIAP